MRRRAPTIIRGCAKAISYTGRDPPRNEPALVGARVRHLRRQSSPRLDGAVNADCRPGGALALSRFCFIVYLPPASCDQRSMGIRATSVTAPFSGRKTKASPSFTSDQLV